MKRVWAARAAVSFGGHTNTLPRSVEIVAEGERKICAVIIGYVIRMGRIETRENGRHENANRTRELDPLAVTGTRPAWILFSARHDDEAIRELHATLTMTPDDALAHWFLGFSFIGEGKSEHAIAPLERAVFLSHGSPGAMGVLARAYGHAGRRSDAPRLIGELNRRRQ
jgi:Flp pilus assembly protein TadD